MIIAENNSVNDGVIKLLDLLKETNKPGYLQALLTALEANGLLNRVIMYLHSQVN